MALESALFLLGAFCATAAASRGDSTLLYRQCVEWARRQNCSLDGKDAYLSRDVAPLWLRLLGWSCTENCRYECMWITVGAFQDDGLPVPQFHGKWPFVRILGIQEPASALASLLNFLAHLAMTRKFMRRVLRTSPMYGTWMWYSLFSMAAWLFSTIFHTRDTPLTEKLDYFGALSFMLCSLYACISRIWLGRWGQQSPALLPIVLSGFFLSHTAYLVFVKFDYKYNLIVNVGIGAVSSLLWLIWCLPRCRRQPHNAYALFTILCLNLLVGLELLDFPPLLWCLDAHALWHFGTILLAVPWYRFAIQDSRLLCQSFSAPEDVRQKTL